MNTTQNDVIFIGSYDKKLYAIDANTGVKKWEFLTGNTISASPAYENGIVYVGSWDKKFYVVDATTETKKWEFLGVATRGITIDNGILYGATLKNNDPTTHAVSAYDATSGTVKWEYKLAIQSSALSTVSKGLIYFTGDTGDKVVALDTKTGTKKWEATSSAYATEGCEYMVMGEV